MRAVPQDLDAERSVLGSMMLDPRAVDEAAVRLAPHHFHDPRHREAFQAMLSLAAQSQPVDQVTVGGLTKFEGARDYLANLTETTPTAVNVGFYASTVIEKAARRAIIQAAMEAADLAANSEEGAEAIADKAAAAMSQAAAAQNEEIAVSVRDLLRTENARLERAHKGEIERGIETGFIDLDARLGGLCPANLIIVAGRPAMGKTALATLMASNAAERGAKVLFFSMEMGQAEVTQRLLSSVSRVDLNRIRYGQLQSHDWPKAFSATQRLYSLPFAISTKADLTIMQLRSLTRRWRAQNGGLDLVVVDYLQLMSGNSRNGREREVAEISRGLKALAMELKIPIVALAQLSRACESRDNKRPRLSDLRESGGIEQDADAVLFVYRDDYYDPKSPDQGVAEIIIGKNRNGLSGADPVRLKWTPECTRFDNLSGGA